MDCPQVKVESPEDKQLEPLLILEEGDEPADVINNRERGRTVLRVTKSDEDETDDAVRDDAQDHNNVQPGRNNSEVTDAARSEEDDVNPGRQRVEGCENITTMDERLSGGTTETAVRPEKMPQEDTQEPEETDTRDKPTARVDVKLRPKNTLSPDDAKQMVRIPNDDHFIIFSQTQHFSSCVNTRSVEFWVRHFKRPFFK